MDLAWKKKTDNSKKENCGSIFYPHLSEMGTGNKRIKGLGSESSSTSTSTRLSPLPLPVQPHQAPTPLHDSCMTLTIFRAKIVTFAPHLASLIANAFPIPLVPPVTWHKDEKLSLNRLSFKLKLIYMEHEDQRHELKWVKWQPRESLTTTWALLISVFFFVKKSKVKIQTKPTSTATIRTSNILNIFTWPASSFVRPLVVRELPLNRSFGGWIYALEERGKGGAEGKLLLEPG